MKPCETLFERPEGPAIAFRQVLDGLAGFVEWTDVAALDRVPVSLLHPPEGKALGPADIRALGVDPTCALWVEEGAGTLGMRNPRGEQLGVATANGLGLHVEDRQPIHATGATTLPAFEARGMQNMKPARLAIDLGVQRHDDGIGDRFFQRTTFHARSVRRRSCPSTRERPHPASPRPLYPVTNSSLPRHAMTATDPPATAERGIWLMCFGPTWILALAAGPMRWLEATTSREAIARSSRGVGRKIVSQAEIRTFDFYLRAPGVAPSLSVAAELIGARVARNSLVPCVR